jgi:hypothetical protein
MKNAENGLGWGTRGTFWWNFEMLRWLRFGKRKRRQRSLAWDTDPVTLDVSIKTLSKMFNE